MGHADLIQKSFFNDNNFLSPPRKQGLIAEPFFKWWLFSQGGKYITQIKINAISTSMQSFQLYSGSVSGICSVSWTSAWARLSSKAKCLVDLLLVLRIWVLTFLGPSLLIVVQVGGQCLWFWMEAPVLLIPLTWPAAEFVTLSLVCLFTYAVWSMLWWHVTPSSFYGVFMILKSRIWQNMFWMWILNLTE